MPAPPKLGQLLDEALALPPGERLAWVERLGAEHDALKPRLRALLKRSTGPAVNAQLDTLPKDGAEREIGLARFGAAAHTAGSLVGAYRLVPPLGAGAMGVVWLAEARADGYRREVALKFAHMAPKRSDLLVRLAREQRLLAALDHPNIARLHDAGVTPEGQPYLVLEYVEGQALDVYCRERRPSLDRKLALFVQIANAVAHAHERNIVHRDLKPANALVTADGSARLLDFGIGKLLDSGVPDVMQLSALTGQPLTPAYASPEQILGEPAGFASDIYSLGVILFELLTGTRPYNTKAGSNRALREAILDTIPPPPSTLVEERALQRQLSESLDAIAAQALSKKAKERQASAAELARQVAQVLARS
jgi:serine/threonine-protein kinase